MFFSVSGLLLLVLGCMGLYEKHLGMGTLFVFIGLWMVSAWLPKELGQAVGKFHNAKTAEMNTEK